MKKKQIKIFILEENEHNNIFVYEDNELIEQYSESNEERRLEGNIYWGKVTDVMKNLEYAFVDIGERKKGIIHVSDIITGRDKIDKTKSYKIETLVKQNDEVIVQIKKDGINSKGAKLTKDVKIFGKYVILMPFSNDISISKKITSEEERDRITKILEAKGLRYGIIARTLSENADEKEILKDLNEVLKEWTRIKEKAIKVKAPAKVYDNNGMIGKILIDYYSKDLEVITNSEKILSEVKKISKDINVNMNKDLKMEKVKAKKIWLNCGGYITIDQTEALVAIDVNSGKFEGKENFEKSVLKVNLEAADAIAKEIRLNDLGGIIIIDFIDMNEEGDREKVRERMIENVKNDRARVQVYEFTKLGLLEMIRKQIFAKNCEE